MTTYNKKEITYDILFAFFEYHFWSKLCKDINCYLTVPGKDVLKNLPVLS